MTSVILVLELVMYTKVKLQCIYRYECTIEYLTGVHQRLVRVNREGDC